MRSGRHAAGDGSFGRSAGGAAFRGAVLLALAVLLGVVLLQATDDEGDPFTQRAEGRNGAAVTTTTAADGGSSTASTNPAVRPPAQVKVIALNASGVSGVARKASDALAKAGYQVVTAGNANARSQSSFVYFTPGFEPEARELARGLGLAPTSAQALPSPPPANDLKGAEVVVVIGPDLAEKLNPPASTTTSTTAR